VAFLGCLNGGGQLQAPSGGAETSKEFLMQVEQAYDAVPKVPAGSSTQVQDIYREWLGHPGSDIAKAKLHTRYHAVEKTLANPLAVQW